ncbi:hypothetical protein EAF04_006103 [Stromatinia cepivora]|nr:hypothetical protein EAF04_006103 [Stromatinia cepivora]
MTNTLSLPIPGVKHGERIALSILDERAQTDPQSPWVSIPVDDEDISKGYKDITYGQFSNAVNHAAHWLVQHLPASQETFEPFAYVGPKDLRYPILAMAAGKVGKVGKVMILPSPMMTPEAQLYILDKKNCNLYVRPESMGSVVDHIVQRREGLEIVAAPALEDLLQDKVAEQFIYGKSWEEGKDDPWLTFHTSGTTAAKLTGDEETHLHHYTFKRWYTPLPMIHFVGMLMVLSMTTFIHMVVVLGPSKLPSPETLIDILKFGRVDGALLVPAAIDALCRDPSGLAALRSLQYIHYAGAPLDINSGRKLSSDVRLIPCIGSTEDYIEFNTNAGAEFKPRPGNLYELVDGLYASTVEREIERHELVQAALIGGHGQPKPVLLIETVPDAHVQGSHAEFMQSLLPYLEKANALCYDSVRVFPELVLLAQPEKPFVRTLKGSVARIPSLSLYEQEIKDAYNNIL